MELHPKDPASSACCGVRLRLERNELGSLRTVCPACLKVLSGWELEGPWTPLPDPE